MAVQFILGASGTGKTEYLYRTIIREAGENKDTTYYFIVPEQFSLETQRDIVKRHPDGGICNIDVISLARLSHKVFAELGGEPRQVLKDIGKSMAIRRILTECGEELSLFRANARQSGFVDEVKSLLSELYQYGIDEGKLEEMAARSEGNPLLMKKLNDVRILYRHFSEFLGEHYMTSEGIYDVLAECIGEAKAVENCVIVMDGFTGFTPSQYALLQRLMQKAKKFYVAFTLEEAAYQKARKQGGLSAHELFFMSWRSVKKTEQLAGEAGCEVLPPYFASWNTAEEAPEAAMKGQKVPALAHLERALFRYPAKIWKPETPGIMQPPEQELPETRKASGIAQASETGKASESVRLSETGETSEPMWVSGKPEKPDFPVMLYAGSDMDEECRFVVTKALGLLQTEGYRYRDIAVIVSDVALYGERLVREFERAGLPCFLDYKKNLSENLCADYVKTVLRIAEQGFVPENVISYVKNGLSDYTPEEAWDLENYCLAVGVRSYQFTAEWKRTYKTRTEVPLEKLNKMRERIVAELSPVVRLFAKKGVTVRELTTELFYFFKEHNLEQKLAAREAALAGAGDRLRAKEYSQVYRVLLGLFDELVELLGGEELTAKEYRELVETGLHEAKVGLIPMGMEQIVIGDMERTRIKDIRALFFLGVNDGKIPAAADGRGILSDKDRRLLADEHLELSPNAAERACREQFYLYMNMTKPKERLYLTYAAVAEDGSSLRASYLVGKLQAIFPGLAVQTHYASENMGMAEELVGSDRGERAFLDGLRQFACSNAQEEFAGLYRFYAEKLPKEELSRLERAAFSSVEKERLSLETARLLYGGKLFGSVTRMEQYAACAFAHFLHYGMHLEERNEYRMAAPDLGNLYHDALKRFGEALLADGRSWQELGKTERDSFAEKAVQEAVENYASDIFVSSARNRYLTEQAKQVVCQNLEIMSFQLAGSGFSPMAFEQEFYHTDRNLNLYGKIDRLDICETADARLVKIVDYKSGNKNFKAEQLYYGLSLQLAAYLTAAMEMQTVGQVQLMEQKPSEGQRVSVVEQVQPMEQMPSEGQRVSVEKQVQPMEQKPSEGQEEQGQKTRSMAGAGGIKKKLPAAMFYYHIDDPLVDKCSDPQAELAKKLRVNGLVNSDAGIIRQLSDEFADASGEKSLAASVRSLKIPVATDKEGHLARSSKVADSGHFSLMSDYVFYKLKTQGEQILQGDVEIAPYRLGRETGCEYCAYAAVCGFDKRNGGQYRKLVPLSQEEAWRRMEQEMREAGLRITMENE